MRDKVKTCICLFCGEYIIPEEALNTKRKGDVMYIFQCENIDCQALYESYGTVLPDINVQYRPHSLEELDFDDN